MAGDYDIVHVSTPIAGFITRTVFASLKGKISTKLVYTAYGLHFFKEFGFIRNFIFSSLEKYDPHRGQFKSWIGRITANRCATLLKRTINFSMRLEEAITPELGEDSFAYLDQLSKAEIGQLLADMPKGYRTIFLLSVIDEYSHKEISELLNITPDTSRSQLFRAIKWIRKNIFPNTKDMVYGTL